MRSIKLTQQSSYFRIPLHPPANPLGSVATSSSSSRRHQVSPSIYLPPTTSRLIPPLLFQQTHEFSTLRMLSFSYSPPSLHRWPCNFWIKVKLKCSATIRNWSLFNYSVRYTFNVNFFLNPLPLQPLSNRGMRVSLPLYHWNSIQLPHGSEFSTHPTLTLHYRRLFITNYLRTSRNLFIEFPHKIDRRTRCLWQCTYVEKNQLKQCSVTCTGGPGRF